MKHSIFYFKPHLEAIIQSCIVRTTGLKTAGKFKTVVVYFYIITVPQVFSFEFSVISTAPV